MADVKSQPLPLGGTAIKPPNWDRSGFEAFRYFIYDPDNGKFFSRTPKSWLKIFVFYCVYYTLLAAFWLASLQMFFLTIPANQPRWLRDQSLIGSNPGVGLKPVMDDVHIDSSLFIFNTEDKSTNPTNRDGEGVRNADYTQRMENFLMHYNNQKGLKNCTNDEENRQNKGRCIFDLSLLGECGVKPFGYLPDENGIIRPCMYLKLNKIFALDPRPIEPEQLDIYSDDEISADMKSKIKNAQDPNQVFFDCYGRFNADKEAVKLKFFPEEQGISLKYFPFRGGNFHSPLMAVQVEIPEEKKGQMVHMECKAWYRGVKHDRKHKLGLTQFEVMMN